MSRIFLIFFAACFLSIVVFGQPTSQIGTEEQLRRMNQWDDERRRKSQNDLTRLAQDENFYQRREILMSEEKCREKLREIEDQTLSGQRSRLLPDAKYINQFIDFLADEKTGITRIFPDMKCDEGKVVSVKEMERCADTIMMRGGGSFYSFRNRAHWTDRKYFSDIHFIDDRFVVSDTKVFGIIGEIGDYKLEELSTASDPVRFLETHSVKTTESKISADIEKFKKGVRENGILYTTSVPAKLNSTYVLRSIGYQATKKFTLNVTADIIVAFRIIAKESDGSLIFLWKQLEKRSAPRRS